MEEKFIGVFAVRGLELVKRRLSGAAAACAQRWRSVVLRTVLGNSSALSQNSTMSEL